MVSEKFMVNSDTERMAAARYATESFARQVKLNKRNTLRLDLLVEETLGMTKAMLNEFYGQLWFVEKYGVCEIHFEATADMDSGKKRELLDLSSTGKNVAARGFMARLGEVMSGVLRGFGNTLDAYGQETIQYGIVHTPEAVAMGADISPIWTLQAYRTDLAKVQASDDAADEALEDLEKSIVARIADDVIVGVKGDRVDLIIIKRF